MSLNLGSWLPIIVLSTTNCRQKKKKKKSSRPSSQLSTLSQPRQSNRNRLACKLSVDILMPTVIIHQGRTAMSLQTTIDGESSRFESHITDLIATCTCSSAEWVLCVFLPSFSRSDSCCFLFVYLYYRTTNKHHSPLPTGLATLGHGLLPARRPHDGQLPALHIGGLQNHFVVAFDQREQHLPDSPVLVLVLTLAQPSTSRGNDSVQPCQYHLRTQSYLRS